MKCRHCKSEISQTLIDLGTSPPSNSYLEGRSLSEPELFYPLKVSVCNHCWLIQTEDYARANELFDANYAYFSSISTTWLKHAADYVTAITKRLDLDKSSFVVEVAANDGYLLKNFVAAGIPCLGIEPTASTARAAELAGVPIRREFFGTDLARRLAAEGKQADLIIGNNVYAHVPDINDFTAGLREALKPGGTITLEFPHALRMLQQVQFDTIYHEHFSYLSLCAVTRIFGEQQLRIFDVEELPTHGGSLRIYASHVGDRRSVSPRVSAVVESEFQWGMQRPECYRRFQAQAETIKDNLLEFLIATKNKNRSIAAYGAAAKGNTLLNFAGVRHDLLPYVCDAAPSKQGKFMPGSRIPIESPTVLRERRPDYVLVLPWNIADEVTVAHRYIAEWGGRFFVAVPELREVK